MDRKRMTRMLCALLCALLMLTNIPTDLLRASADAIDSEVQLAAVEVQEEAAPEEEAVEVEPVEVEPEAEPGQAPPEPDPAGAEDSAPGGDTEAVPPEDALEPEDAAPELFESLEAAAARWVAEMDAQDVRGDFARALWLYDAVIENLEPGDTDDALSALAESSGSALGYARIYEALLVAAGIECQTVEGDGAAWNLAKLDGAWTHIDAFADDAPDGFGRHFGLTDAAMARERAWSGEFPACADTRNNYFVHDRGYRAFAGIEELRALLAAALAAGEADLPLYSAGEPLPVSDALPELLAEFDPEAWSEVSEKGCYTEVTLHPSPELSLSAPLVEEEEEHGVLLLAAAVPATAIVPSVTELNLGVGEKFHIDYTLEPEGADPVKMTYDAQPRGPLEGDQKGNLVAKKAGKTTLILQTKDKKLRVEIPVTIEKAPTKVVLNNIPKAMGVGETVRVDYSLTPADAHDKVTLSLTKPQPEGVATLSEDGLLTANEPGAFTLNVKTYNGKSASAAVEVKPAPTEIIPPTEPLTIGMGDSCTPEWAFDAGAAGKLSFESSAPGIAAVDPDSGEITAAGVGDAVITATAYNGLQASLSVTVVPAPTALLLSAEGGRTTIGVKEELQLLPDLRMGDGPFEGSCAISYKSSKGSVAAVSADGLVTAKATGSAKITATAYDGKLTANLTITVKKAPTSVSIAAGSTVLGVGETTQLTSKLSSGSAGAVSFSIPEEQQTVATVTEDGLVTATNVGQVSITAATYNGKKASKSVTIEVKAAPRSVTLSAGAITIGVGDSFTPGCALDDGAAGKVTFTSDSPEFASVDPDSGKITAVSAGAATITAAAYNGVSAELTVTVVPAPTAVRLSASRTAIGVNETLQLNTEILSGDAPFEGDVCTLKYSSSNGSVASVSANGLVTAKKTGSAKITVTAYNSVKKTPVTASISISVKKAPTSVSIVADRTVLGVGESTQLTSKLSSGSAGKVSFSIESGEEFATVTEDGLVTATNVGQVSITAATYNGKKASKSVTIEVKAAPRSVTLSAGAITIGVGDSFTPGCALDDDAAGKVTFTSDSPEFASVDPDSGKITAVSAGAATITAAAYNGVSAELTVTVVPAPTAVKLSASRTAIGVNETLQLNTEILSGDAPFEGDVCTLKYSSSSSSVASVSADGLVTAKKTGSAKITVTAYNSVKKTPVTASITVSVKKAPSSVSIVADRTVLGVGETMQLTSKLSSGSAGKVSFAILEEQQTVATVTEDGLVTAMDVGTVSITATTYNGKKASTPLSIEVKPAPTSVTPDRESVKLGVGDSLTPVWELNEGSAGKLSFTSDAPEFASVDPDSGKITAVSEGDATITASAYGVAFGEMTVTVVPAPTAVKLSAERTAIGVNETLQLNTEILSGEEPFAGDVCTLKYSSSSSSVASVSANGLVTAKKTGSAKITATAYNSVKKTPITASISISVKKAPSSVSIVADRTVLGVGETMQLTSKLSSGSAGKVSFAILEEQQTVATVTEDGLVTAMDVGTVSITATTYNGEKASTPLSIEVKPAPTSVTPDRDAVKLGVGDSLTPVWSLNEGSAGKLSFTSDVPEFASVDPDSGKITAVSEGEATITASAYGVAFGEMTVTVVPAPTAVKLSAERTAIGVNETLQLNTEILSGDAPFEGDVCTLKYSSSSGSVAPVSADGLVTAKKTGSAKITVTAYNSVKKTPVTASITITVKKAPSNVRFITDDPVLLGVGETMELKPKIQLSSGSAGAVSFAIPEAQQTVATVTEDGLVTAVAEGTATVTATTYNGKSGTCDITVVPAPTGIEIDAPQRISVGQQNFQPKYTLTPENAHTTVTYELISGEGIEIKDGTHFTAQQEGEVVIRAHTHLEDLYCDFPLTVVPTPEAISLPENFAVVLDSEGAQIPVTFLPENSTSDLAFSLTGGNAKKGFFTVDPNTGWVTPKKTGNCQVTVTTKNTPKKLTAKTTVWVLEDLSVPVVLKFAGESPVYVDEGDIYTPELYIFPEGADAQMEWTSADESIAAILDDGTIKGVSTGHTTITGKCMSNTKLAAVKFKIIVTSDARCLVMPDHRTKDPATISANKNRIAKVQKSAYAELDELVQDGCITESERTKRQGYVDRAFQMYNFAWTPNAKKGYWKAANSEGGQKDFKKGTYYYGMPYTQYNRCHSNLNGYTKASTDGYDYRITTNAFESRNYPGSDCSSYCSMAVWGLTNGRRGDNTNSIAGASYYKTPGGKKPWKDLRTGDLICSGGHHVVMFLYYTNKAKTQFVVIEQGGGGDDLYSNCVSTSIRDASYYTSRGYSIRRPSGLNMTWRDRLA